MQLMRKKPSWPVKSPWKTHFPCLAILCGILSAIFPFGPGTRVQAEEKSSLIEEVWTWGILGAEQKPYVSIMRLFRSPQGPLVRGTLQQSGQPPLPLTNPIDRDASFRASLEIDGDPAPMTVFFEGSVDHDLMEGQMILQRSDQNTSLPWKAFRLPDFPLNGSWKWELSTSSETTLKATLEIEQSTNILKGKLIFEERTIPLEAMVFKEGMLTFTSRGEAKAVYHSRGFWMEGRLMGSVTSESFGTDRPFRWNASR